MRELWRRDDLSRDWRIWIATRPGICDDRSLRFFACLCDRSVWCQLTDERSRRAVVVAEAYCRGEATGEELAAARDAAMTAAMTAARDAARDAAMAAARDAAWDAARADINRAARWLPVNFGDMP